AALDRKGQDAALDHRQVPARRLEEAAQRSLEAPAHELDSVSCVQLEIGIADFGVLARDLERYIRLEEVALFVLETDPRAVQYNAAAPHGIAGKVGASG